VNSDERYMSRAIELALKGIGRVSPNPMVGCVIVHNNEIVGEGYHENYGEAHAEVNAINSVKDQAILGDCTAYVTLEPCAHHGKTPPCSDLLIEKKIRRVVIGCGDSNDQVNGKGIAQLKEAGMDIDVSILEYQARRLNKRFFTFVEKKRPYVILKWAQTEDGFIARENFDSKWISDDYSRQLVHKWRTEEDAILVGKNTALYDNPRLTSREWIGKNPIRVVIDNQLELHPNMNLFDGAVPTYVMNLKEEYSSKGVDYLQYDGSIQNLLSRLYEKSIQSVIVEGGAKTLESFIEDRLWDEARVFTSKQEFEKGIESPPIGGRLLKDVTIVEDRLEIYENVH
jgi:diaminohydroxyphosphoribosylaminopyrimidine deaminase/5-amino-6-(5-phosphoribosylamino)uracil reductase